MCNMFVLVCDIETQVNNNNTHYYNADAALDH